MPRHLPTLIRIAGVGILSNAIWLAALYFALDLGVTSGTGALLSAVGDWSGVTLSTLLTACGTDLSKSYVRFECADSYHCSIDMAPALHPQTILALDFLGRPLPTPFGPPCRLRIPTKLGFKNAMFLARITVTDEFPGGYWEDQG